MATTESSVRKLWRERRLGHRWLVLGLLLGAGFPSALAAELPGIAARSASSTDEELDEVIVRGTSLSGMRAMMIEIEDQLYARYNELNGIKDYDVHCRLQAPPGTKIKQRVCNAVYFDKALDDEAKQFLDGVSAPPPQSVEILRGDDFRRHLRKVINGDPRLRKLARQRDALEKRYVAAQKRLFKR